MSIKVSDFQTRLPSWKVEDVGVKPEELDRDDVFLKPAADGKVAPAQFEDAVEAFYNTPENAPAADTKPARISVADFEKKLVGWTVEDAGDQAGFLDRGDVVLKSTPSGAKVAVSYDQAVKAFDGDVAGSLPAPVGTSPIAQPLPVELRPAVTREGLLGKSLGQIKYSNGEARNMFPVWHYRNDISYSKDLRRWPARTVDNAFQSVQGSFEDAVKVAAERAQTSKDFAQAQAVVDVGHGEWLVSGLGSFDNNNAAFLYTPIDGVVAGTSFSEAFGSIESVEKLESSLAAIVGKESIIDLRNTPVS